ncbi:MAG: hypothetical protein JWP85_248 [Rhodoglobus sp.]|nr:hypothetical protein [Rhodoglobus sp.]
MFPDEVELLEEAAGCALFFGLSEEPDEEPDDPESEDDEDDEDDAELESDAGFARESVR